ncbi:MAG: DUF6916 family protein [bacterium]
MLDKLKSTDFSPLINQKFRLYTEGRESIEIELIEVTPLGPKHAHASQTRKREPFSILFRGPAGAPLPQRIYRIEHQRMGVLDIFLVPIGPGEEGMQYEAVFT